jgi:saccharopine dehydrogenase-like NADP-dependent oxidoreductase
VIVSVGLAPGLTNLLAASVHAATPRPVDLAVLLGAGEEHGAAATEWSYRLLGRHFDDHGRSTRNYTSPSVFELPGHGRRRLYRVDFSDQHALSRDLGTRVRTYFVSTPAWLPRRWPP